MWHAAAISSAVAAMTNVNLINPSRLHPQHIRAGAGAAVVRVAGLGIIGIRIIISDHPMQAGRQASYNFDSYGGGGRGRGTVKPIRQT